MKTSRRNLKRQAERLERAGPPITSKYAAKNGRGAQPLQVWADELTPSALSALRAHFKGDE